MIPAPPRLTRRFLAAVLFLVLPALPSLAGAQRMAALAAPVSQRALTGPVVSGPVVSEPILSELILPEPTIAATPPALAAPPFAGSGVAGVHTTNVAADVLARGDRRAESVAPAVLARRARAGLEQSEVLMIVGGAAVLLGLVTDGAASDFLLIGGAGVGLYGLYRFLQ